MEGLESQAETAAAREVNPRAMSSHASGRSRRHRWMRRMLALAFGIGIVVSAEVTCRLAGWGDPRLREDPSVGFACTRPLFRKDTDASLYRVAGTRLEYFARETFPIEKGPKTRRIFCLGGSTVQGRPWSIATSFTTWLEIALNIVDPSVEWDVINCGGISYASYRLVPILEECLAYEPDLVILCTGHNEFLEDRSYPATVRSPLLHWSSNVRLVNLARKIVDRWRSGTENVGNPERTELPIETEPILNFHGGLAVYHRDDAWREGVVEHFGINLRRMAAMCHSAGVPLLLVQPASNLRDSPPFKWEPPAAWEQSRIEEWGELITRGRELREQQPEKALHVFEQALEMDAANPLTHYELGLTHRQLRDSAAARESFVAARDRDVCPLRMISPLEQQMRTVAGEWDLPLLDMHALLEAESRDEILGDDWLVDHIHPSVEGHQLVARGLVDWLDRLAVIDMAGDTVTGHWVQRIQAGFRTHLESLDSAYFIRGQRMLEGLRTWSEGRADGPPAAERFPGRAESF